MPMGWTAGHHQEQNETGSSSGASSSATDSDSYVSDTSEGLTSDGENEKNSPTPRQINHDTAD